MQKFLEEKINHYLLLSWALGAVLFFIKGYAFLATQSSAVFSDLMESLVHIVVASFASYSLWLARKPPDREHPYGHDRITFFSLGLEGGVILVTALYIVWSSMGQLLRDELPSHLDVGMYAALIATLSSSLLGSLMMWKGRVSSCRIVEANGKHLLADGISSGGVLLALLLTDWTGFACIDSLVGIAIGLYILVMGLRLLLSAIHGLMDRIDPSLDYKLRELLKAEGRLHGVEFHRLRCRDAGTRVIAEVHLLFPDHHTISQAHEIATRIEHMIETKMECEIDFVSHLEPIEEHDAQHSAVLGREG